jgi:hypothetical protein
MKSRQDNRVQFEEELHNEVLIVFTQQIIKLQVNAALKKYFVALSRFFLVRHYEDHLGFGSLWSINIIIEEHYQQTPCCLL